MPRTAHPMTSISTALQAVHAAFEGLVAENHQLRQHLHGIVQRASVATGATVRRRGQPPGRAARSAPAKKTDGAAKKRGRKFKFTDAEAAELKKQVDGGKSALALAKELKISLPTMYNTLKRAGWSGRRGRPAGRTTRPTNGRAPGGPRKRGRAFKFTDEQAAGFRKQVEGGKSALTLAKELKISVPTMYNTLKRVGWKGRKS